jgi:hypothetical protein
MASSYRLKHEVGRAGIEAKRSGKVEKDQEKWR